MLHFLIATVGSAGDVLPLIAAGAYLRSRGHRVTLVANPVFEGTASVNGLEFEALCSVSDYEGSLRDKHLLATRYCGLFFNRHSVAWNRKIYDCVLKHADRGLVVLAADRPNLWADLTACQETRTPSIRFQFDLPMVPEALGLCLGLPDGTVQHRLAATRQVMWASFLRQRGRKAGTNHAIRHFRTIRRMVPIISLWPAWLVPAARSTRRHHHFGFLPAPHFDVRDAVAPTRTDRRLIVFVLGTEGTTRSWIRQFLETSAAICERLDCEGLLLGGEGTEINEPLSRRLVWRSFVPLGMVLPEAVAIVHHGGIGTAAMAISCGVPQLILPRVFMQPMNAEWLRRAGLCYVLNPREYTAARAALSVERLCADVSYRRTANEVAARPGFRANMVQFAEFLEEAGRDSPLSHFGMGKAPVLHSNRSGFAIG